MTPWFESPSHLGPIAEVIERAIHAPQNVALSTPPQHAKTETISHALVHLMRRMPRKRHVYVTYEANRAQEVSAAVQRIARDAGFSVEGTKSRWRTDTGAALLATGIGGPLTGYAADGAIIIDDPHKNRAEAESATIRGSVDDWFKSTALTRRHPSSSVIVVHTRWHEDDLIGRLVKRGWRWINLPAIDDQGCALWPKHRPRSFLDEQRGHLGEYEWASLYMGQPRPRGGAVFGDVHFFETLPESYRIAIGVDFAYTAKTSSDYSVAVVLAKGREKDSPLYVLEVVREQVTAPNFAATLKKLRERYSGASIFSYIGGTEQGIVDMLARPPHGVVVTAWSASGKGDKFVRAQPTAATWNRGKILVRQGASWAPTFVGEVAAFTGVSDAYDDEVDALVAAHDALSTGVKVGVRTSGERIDVAAGF